MMWQVHSRHTFAPWQEIAAQSQIHWAELPEWWLAKPDKCPHIKTAQHPMTWYLYHTSKDGSYVFQEILIVSSCLLRSYQGRCMSSEKLHIVRSLTNPVVQFERPSFKQNNIHWLTNKQLALTLPRTSALCRSWPSKFAIAAGPATKQKLWTEKGRSQSPNFKVEEAINWYRH